MQVATPEEEKSEVGQGVRDAALDASFVHLGFTRDGRIPGSIPGHSTGMAEPF